MSHFIIAIGLLMVVEGAPWFLSPRSMRQFLTQLSQLPDANLRLVGLTSMGIGLALVYLGTR